MSVGSFRIHRPLLRLARNALLGLSALYFLGLVIYLVLRFSVGDRYWLVGALNIFAIYYFVPLLVAVPLVWVLRARRLGVFALILALIALWWATPYFIPKAASSRGDITLRVMTFNIWAENPSTSSIESYIEQMNPDIVCLQEITQKFASEGVASLREKYPYQANIGYQWSNLILSRYPFTSVETIPQTSQRTYSDQQRVTLTIQGRTIAIYNIHLSYPLLGESHFSKRFGILEVASRYDDKARNQQLQQLIERIQTESQPALVMGDFNLSDQSPTYQKMASVLRDSWKEQGWGLGATWPNAPNSGLPAFLPPLLRIDYIWHSDEFDVVQIRQGIALSSDHLPLVATLELGHPS